MKEASTLKNKKEASISRNIIELDDSSEEERLRQQNSKSFGTGMELSRPRIKIEKDISVKDDILSQGIRQKTTLLILADNEKDKAPVTIALAGCRTSDELFDRLIRV